MLTDLVRVLRCPVCAGELVEAAAGTARALRCARRHSFDIARQGYVNLAGPRLRHTGDSAAMVAARAAFLARGHYDFITAALRDLAAAHANGVSSLIVDAGAGTGYHLASLVDAEPGRLGLALDASRFAVRRAARAHARVGAVLCDTLGRLPLADAAAAVVLDVFAPRNGAEFRRVLHADGALLVVTPAAAHLRELVSTLGLLTVDEEKNARLDHALAPWFEGAEQLRLEQRLHLTREEVVAAVAMGPSARHLRLEEIESRAHTLAEPTQVTAAVHVTRFRPRGTVL